MQPLKDNISLSKVGKTKRQRDKETKRQKDEKTRIQQDKKRKNKDQKQSLILQCQLTGSFALLQCFQATVTMVQFYFNECNFTIVKLNAFNKHMKKQCYLALGTHTKLLFLDNGIDGANCMKRKQFKWNE